MDFWAPGAISAGLLRLKFMNLRKMAGRGLVLKVNTDEYPTVAAQFGVQSIPYFVLLRGGIIIAERTGVGPWAEMRWWFAMAA